MVLFWIVLVEESLKVFVDIEGEVVSAGEEEVRTIVLAKVAIVCRSKEARLAIDKGNDAGVTTHNGRIENFVSKIDFPKSDFFEI